MKDIQFTQAITGQIKPKVLNKTLTRGLILYQKLLVLLLSDQTGAFRQSEGTNLIRLLQGSNTPQDAVLASLGQLACADVKILLDQQDRDLLKSLSASAQNGKLYITVELESGETYKGILT